MYKIQVVFLLPMLKSCRHYAESLLDFMCTQRGNKLTVKLTHSYTPTPNSPAPSSEQVVYFDNMNRFRSC